MYILGIGAAFPPTKISEETIEAIDPSCLAGREDLPFGVQTRYSCVAEGKLGTPRSSIFEANKLLSESPTSVAVRALHQALERAGITPEQIGLIIGDNPTPIETTPSEAQRVGEALGLKIPCYDLTGGSGALLLQLDALRKMKPERTPEYMVCLSTVMATTRIDYRRGVERFLFGDGAVAIVASCRHPGRLTVEHSSVVPTPQYRHTINLPMYGDISISPPRASDLAHMVAKEREGISSRVQGISGSYLVPPQLSLEGVRVVEDLLSIPREKVLWSGDVYGYTLGASPLLPISLRWDSIARGDQIVVIDAGMGPHCSSLVVRGGELCCRS